MQKEFQMKPLFLQSVLCCALSLTAQLGYAQAPLFPAERPITWIVPYTAGGGTDAAARLLASGMSDALNQSIVVDNKPGASTLIGATALARARPDGYTVGTIDPASVAISPHVQDKMPFDAKSAFSYVGGTAIYPWLIVVNPQLPVRTMSELVAYAKAKPGGVSLGVINPVGTMALTMLRFEKSTGAKFVQVPYKGDPQAIQDVLGGQLDMYIANTVAGLPHVQSGKLRALAVASMKRIASLPDLPTLDEQGFKGFEMFGWQALAAPGGTPKEVIARLNKELNEQLRNGEAGRSLKALGVQPNPTTPEAIAELAQRESVRFKSLLQEFGTQLKTQ